MDSAVPNPAPLRRVTRLVPLPARWLAGSVAGFGGSTQYTVTDQAGISRSVYVTGEVVLVRDAYKDARFNPEWDLTSGYRTRSILCVPMRDTSGKTSGVMQVLVQVSSRNTRWLASSRACPCCQSQRAWRTSSRSCSLACRVFFKAQMPLVELVPQG